MRVVAFVFLNKHFNVCLQKTLSSIVSVLFLWLSSSCYSKQVPFPSETSPEGAYARIAIALAEGKPQDVFPFLEDEAQWATYTIQKERAAALTIAQKNYPPKALANLEASYQADAHARDGADVFVRIARARGWLQRIKRDVTGITHIEIQGERATLVTARGSRYSMRKRHVGIWGLTMFTAELSADAERATRDRQQVEQAARTYEQAQKSGSLLGSE